MNHVYRLVWSTTHNALIAVSETSRARGKTGGRSSKVASAVASALLALSGASATLGTLPSYAEDVVINSETYTGLSYGSLESFTNTSLIMSPLTAVNITGNVSTGIANSGVINSYSYGVAVGGDLLGGFTNSSNGLFLSRDISIYVTGELQGGFTNEGRIFSSHSNGVFVNGLMTGNFINTSTGQIKANSVSVQLSAGLDGDFTNHGEISSGNCHGIIIKGAGMTGDFLNSPTGRIYSNAVAINISGGLNGDFTNQGNIVALESHGLNISNGMTGDFLNTSTGKIIANDMGVNIAGDFIGNMTNQGSVVGGDSHGLFVSGSFDGNFINTSGARIIANDIGIGISGGLNGDFTNQGKIIALGSHGLSISNGMTGDFLNTSAGKIFAKNTGVDIVGNFSGNMTNQGSVVSGDSHGFVVRGSFDGNFINTLGASIWANESALDTHEFDFDNINDLYTFTGNITNAGMMYGASGGVVIRGAFTGNFTNEATGVIEGGLRDGVVFGGGVAGNINNAGSILGERYFGASVASSTLPIIELDRDESTNTQFYNDGYVPDHIGLNPRAGIYVHGDLDGNFVNSGTIRAAQAVFIDGNLNGDYSNTGIIDGGFIGLTTSGNDNEPTRRITGNRSFSGNSVVIAGNFSGNFTTSVGQGILVGDYVNDWTLEAGLVPESETIVSLQADTGTADLTSKTVAVHVNQAITDGFTWTAIDSANLLYDNRFSITDNSLLYDFTYIVENDDLKITAVLNGTPETQITSSSDYNGITYISPNGFTVAAGTTILNSGTAVDVSGDVTGNISNSGEIISTGFNNGDGYGISISGNLNGNFDNTATGKINAVDTSALLVQGNLTGNLSNAGEISSRNSHAIIISGSMTGDFTNSQSGRVYANDITLLLQGGIAGDINNHGLIISGDSHAIFVSQTMTGNFLNSASAGIYAEEMAFAVLGTLDGNITNQGEIVSGTSHAIHVSGTMIGNFLNSASASIFANDMAFVVKGALNGNITNEGEIVSGDSHAIHVSGTMIGNFLNSASASIYANDMAFDLEGSLNGNFTNEGEILAANSHGISINGLMTGDFLNTATGRIWANDIGVRLSGLLGNFTNEGEIMAGSSLGIYSRANVTGNFLNSDGGSIWAGRNIAVQFSSSFTGDFTNNGEIFSGSSHGVWIGNMTNGDFVNGATGEIRALNNAVQINNTFNGDFTNHGLITSNGNGDVTSNGNGTGVHIGGMTGNINNSATGSIIGYASGVNIIAGLTGDLNNLGLIKANAGDAIKLGGVLTGTISNTGTLESTDGAGIHVTSSVTGGLINNSGSIDSTDDESGNTGAGSGIYVADGSALTSITNTSTGTIKGSLKSINLANATNPTTVNNSGVLDGDVYLGTAGNVLNINGDEARIIGDVTNNGASSTVNINGTFDSEGTFNVGLFNVNDGGLFNMNHSITATTTTVNNGGTLNVGTGDRNIVGDYLQSSGGTLRFSLTDPLTYGSLNVSGNATVSGGAKIDVVLNGAPASRIDGVLIAGGTLTTNPANIVVTDNSAFYNFSASTTRDNQEIDLISEIDQNGFAAGTTRPTKGIAGALQNMLNNGIPESLQSTYDALGVMDPAQRNNALLQMTPALQGATTQAVVNSLRNMNRIIQSRYESVQGLSSGDASNEQAVWFKTFGNRGDQGNSNTVPGYDSQSYGMVFGADKLITEKTRAGALFTYVRTDIDSNVGNANVNVDSYKIATYASYNIDPKTDINFQMDYGVHRADSARSIGFMGTRAKAEFDGTDWHIAAGIGHTIDLTEKSSITPSLRLDYTNFRTDSYTEKGAGALNNHVKSAVYEEFLLDMGAKFTHQLNDNGLKFIANGGVAYDFINETALATSNLIGGGPSFVTRGLDPSPWLYRGGLGLVKAADSGMEVSARYDVEGRSSDYINQTASVNLRWSF